MLHHVPKTEPYLLPNMPPDIFGHIARFVQQI